MLYVAMITNRWNTIHLASHHRNVVHYSHRAWPDGVLALAFDVPDVDVMRVGLQYVSVAATHTGLV